MVGNVHVIAHIVAMILPAFSEPPGGETFVQIAR
jgi:hypothetical protein